MSRNPLLQPAASTVEQPTRHADVADEAGAFLRQVDVARRLGISQDTWIRWRKAGLTPAAITYPSGRQRWRVEDIDAMVQRQPVESLAGRRRYFRHARDRRARTA